MGESDLSPYTGGRGSGGADGDMNGNGERKAEIACCWSLSYRGLESGCGGARV